MTMRIHNPQYLNVLTCYMILLFITILLLVGAQLLTVTGTDLSVETVIPYLSKILV
jgi:hypothetical protein